MCEFCLHEAVCLNKTHRAGVLHLATYHSALQCLKPPDFFMCLSPPGNAGPAVAIPASPVLTQYLHHRRCSGNIHSMNQPIETYSTKRNASFGNRNSQYLSWLKGRERNTILCNETKSICSFKNKKHSLALSIFSSNLVIETLPKK